MPRMLVVKEDTDLHGVTTVLLRAGLSDARAGSAREALRAMNRHLDPDRIPAGTVLLVPDEPGFNASASRPVVGDPLAGFQHIMTTELIAAAQKLKAGNAARADEHARVTSVEKTAAFKKIVAADPMLKQQLEDAAKAFKIDQENAVQAEQALDVATKGALAELTSLAKLLGSRGA
jgi:hypothetical protein